MRAQVYDDVDDCLRICRGEKEDVINPLAENSWPFGDHEKVVYLALLAATNFYISSSIVMVDIRHEIEKTHRTY